MRCCSWGGGALILSVDFKRPGGGGGWRPGGSMQACHQQLVGRWGACAMACSCGQRMPAAVFRDRKGGP